MFYIDPTFSTKKINKALKENREVTFKAGEYNLTECLILYSNTKVTCERGVLFYRRHKGRMMQTYADKGTIGYAGVHDVSWQGGQFCANKNEANANVITLFHAMRIILLNMLLWGCRGLHTIEINACDHVTVKGCSIYQQSSKKGENFREAIQIDFANYDGLKIKGADKESLCYDNTHCKNITIQDTRIYDCPNGIGTHTVSVKEKYHANIILQDVFFERISGYHIQLFGVDCFAVHGINCIETLKIHIGTKTVGHLPKGGKKVLESPRRNKNICIEQTLID